MFLRGFKKEVKAKGLMDVDAVAQRIVIWHRHDTDLIFPLIAKQMGLKITKKQTRAYVKLMEQFFP